MINQLLYCFRNTLSFMEAKRYRQKRLPPKSILFPVVWITNRCNLRCKMCDQWKTSPELISGELSTQEWFSFIDSVSNMHALIVVITGGEPLIRPDIFDIIGYIHKKGILSHLCTNGTFLNEDTINRLKISGLNSISISLDSYSAQIHNDLRGADCFNIVVKGIKLFKKIAPDIKIGINYIITKRNFRNIYRTISFAESLGVDQIKFDTVHANLMHRYKSIDSFDDLLFTRDDSPELKYEIDRLAQVTSKSKLLTASRAFMKGITHLCNNQYPRLPCYAGYISCAVDALGWVSPCDNFDGNENIRSSSLEEIWKSQAFQQLRNLVENCNSQCWDTTHAELNIRCSRWWFMRELNQILKEIHFYFS